jgi:hypothetical protein
MAALKAQIEKTRYEKVSRTFAGENARAASAFSDCSRQGAGLGKSATG